MQYEFTDVPIFPSRVDRRTAKEKKLAIHRAEAKRQRLQEEFTVEQLMAIGFYEDNRSRNRSYGVEVCTTSAEIVDQDQYEQRTIKVTKISLFLPDNASSFSLQKLNPNFQPQHECYYWKYRIYGNAMLWIILDLLDRVLKLPAWDNCENVPLFWRAGNKNALEFAKAILSDINNQNFKLNIPPPPLVENLEENTKRDMLLRFPSRSIGKITNKAKISYIRHSHTPYDYLWQTSKFGREEALDLCNALIKSQYPELFDERLNIFDC